MIKLVVLALLLQMSIAPGRGNARPGTPSHQPALYNGTVVGTPTFGSVKFGTGTTATSDSNYISLPTGTFNFTPGSAWSIEIQLQTSATGTYEVALNFGGNGWWIGVSPGGKFTVSVAGATLTSSLLTIADGAPHDCLMVVDGSNVYTFVDGVAGTGGSVSYSSISPTSGYIGRYNPTGYSWSGGISEVSLWNIATHETAYTPPTAAYTGSETGLIALYHLRSDGTEY